MSGQRLRVLVVDSNLAQHRDVLEADLADVAAVEWLPVGDPSAPERLGGVDVVVTQTFTEDWAAQADTLRLILAPGVGYDGIARGAVPDGVPVANTAHHANSIAEYVVATTVLLRRGLLRQDDALRRDIWDSSVYVAGMPQPPTLADARVGIVGYGGIGSATWRSFAAFGARGCAVSRTPREPAPDGLAWCRGMDSLPELLRACDVVVLCLPLTDDTRGLIGAPELDLIGPDGVLVNVARGPVVQPQALYDALASRRLGGAVIDTWYSYPTGGAEPSRARPAEQPFGELDSVFMTPHISGVTRETFLGRARDIAENVRRLHDGAPARSVVFVGGER